MSTRTSTFGTEQLTSTDLNALAGTWNAYTPTVSGWTLGNGTVSGRYLQFGYLVGVSATIAVGSTTSVGTTYLDLTLPVSARAYTNVGAHCVIGSARYLLTGYAASATMRLWSVGTSGAFTNFSSSVPGTWASGDDVYINAWYEASAL